MLRARDSTDRPPPPPRRRAPLLAPPRRPLKPSHPEGDFDNVSPGVDRQRPLPPPQCEGSLQYEDGDNADGPGGTGEGGSPPPQGHGFPEAWPAEDDGYAAEDLQADEEGLEPPQAVDQGGSTGFTGWPAEERLEPSPTGEGDENLLLDMQADEDVQEQEEQQGCNVEAVRVIPGPALHNSEPTWQAEITVPAEHGGVRCFGLHDGRQRTMCIRGPTRHQREHAEADCVELEAAAIDGGPKAVRACQGRLQRAKVLISNSGEGNEENQQQEEEEYDEAQAQQIVETDPYLGADDLGVSQSRESRRRSVSQHRERHWERHRRRSRSRPRMETTGRRLRPPPPPAGKGYSDYRANDRGSNSDLSGRVSALLDFLGKNPMPRSDNGRADHDDRRRPPPRDEERFHRKGRSVWNARADSRSKSPRRRNSYRRGCSEERQRQHDRDCAYDTAPWASGRASRHWSDSGRGQGFNGHPGDIEDFLAKSVVDSHAAAQLRACTPEKAAIVMSQGPIAHTRNPSSVLIARIRDADRQLPSTQQPRLPMQSPSGPPPRATPGEVERFIAANPTDTQAENRLRTSAPHLQRLVIDRGPLGGTRNPSSVLLARIRDAEHGRNMQSGIGLPAPPPANGCRGEPEVERLIMRYNLDAKAATTLRMLKPDQQRAASLLPLHEARNPSAFIMAQVSMRFHGGPGGGGDGGRQPAWSGR